MGVIPSAARDLLFAEILRRKLIPRANYALGITAFVLFNKL
jgi:hypothetical protein